MEDQVPVTFAVAGLNIEGILSVPPRARRAAVLCHPHPQFGGDMYNNVITAVAAALGKVGVATLRFNFRSVGRSRGQPGNMTGEVEDTQAAIDYLRRRCGAETLALIGYSFGAIVGLRAGKTHSAVTCLIMIAPPTAMLGPTLLADCRKSLLVVAGTRDPFCPPEAVEQHIHGHGLNASLVRVDGSDHFFLGYEGHVGKFCSQFLLSCAPARGQTRS